MKVSIETGLAYPWNGPFKWDTAQNWKPPCPLCTSPEHGFPFQEIFAAIEQGSPCITGELPCMAPDCPAKTWFRVSVVSSSSPE